MQNPINFMEDSSPFKVPGPPASGDGLLNLLNFNNELVMNLMHMMKKDQPHLLNQINNISKVSEPQQLQMNSNCFKRKFPHETGVPIKDERVRVDSTVKRAKTSPMENLDNHHRESAPFPRQKDPMLDDLMKHVAVLQSQIVRQTEEISMLRGHITNMNSQNVNAGKHSSATPVLQKNPYEVENQLQEVVHLQFTFTKLIDSFSNNNSSDPDKHADDDLSEFRAEVNQLFKQAHRKLSRWKRNQQEMFKELQLTKQLLLKSLTQVVQQKTVKENQKKQVTPAPPLPPPPPKSQTGKDYFLQSERLYHPKTTSSNHVPEKVNLVHSQTQPIFMPQMHQASNQIPAQFRQQISKMPSPMVTQGSMPTTTRPQIYTNYGTTAMQHVPSQPYYTMNEMRKVKSDVYSTANGYPQFAFTKPHHPYPTPPAEYFIGKENRLEKQSIRSENPSPPQTQPIHPVQRNQSSKYASDDSFRSTMKTEPRPTPPAPTEAVIPPRETNPVASGEGDIEKLFVCENCGDAFGTNIQLRLHTKVVHDALDKQISSQMVSNDGGSNTGDEVTNSSNGY